MGDNTEGREKKGDIVKTIHDDFRFVSSTLDVVSDTTVITAEEINMNDRPLSEVFDTNSVELSDYIISSFENSGQGSCKCACCGSILAELPCNNCAYRG